MSLISALACAVTAGRPTAGAATLGTGGGTLPLAVAGTGSELAGTEFGADALPSTMEVTIAFTEELMTLSVRLVSCC